MSDGLPPHDLGDVLPPSLSNVSVCDLGRSWRYSSDEKGLGGEVSLGQFGGEQFVVLAAPPGMGKTAELWRWHLDTAGSVWVDLGLIADIGGLDRACQHGNTAFIDGCEEFDGKAGPLFRHLGQMAASGVRIRLTTRKAWWNEHRDYHPQLGQHSLVELQPLDTNGANTLLENNGLGRSGLKVLSAGDESLTRNPRMLLALHRAREEAGVSLDTRKSIYEVLARSAVAEHNPGMQRAKPGDSASTLRVAKWCALSLLLTGRTVVSQDFLLAPDARLSLYDLRLDAVLGPLAVAVDPASIVNSYLMTTCAGGHRFIDRSIMEYLGAKGLCELLIMPGGRSDAWKMLLTIDVGGETFVPPRLRGLAAWAAELDDTAFEVVFEADPSVVLENDLVSLHDDGLRRLFRAIVADDSLTRMASYSRGILAVAYSAADGFDEISRRLQPSASLEVRRRALEYIHGAELREFDDVIIAILEDGEEDELLRYWAATSISVSMGPDRLGRLRSRLLGPEAPSDSHHRIRGLLLRTLWPAFIGPVELFASLVPPTSEGLLEYEGFLVSDLAQGLQAADVDFALGWLVQILGTDSRKLLPRETLLNGVLDVLANHLTEVSHGEKRDTTLRALGRLICTASNVHTAVFDRLHSQMTLSDLVVIAETIVSHSTDEAGFVFRGSAPLITTARHPDSRIAAEFLRWLFERISLADQGQRSWWVFVFEKIVDPVRDRDVVEEMLALDGERREPFAGLVENMTIDSVPTWRRRPRIEADLLAANIKTPYQLALSVAAGELSWMDFVTEALVKHRLTTPIAGDSFLGRPSDAVWSALGSVATSYVTNFEPRADRSGKFWSVTGDEVALAQAVELLHRRGQLAPEDPALLRFQATLFRCQFFLPSREYDEVLVMSHDLAPQTFAAIADSGLQSILNDTSRNGSLRWLRRYPHGVSADLLESLLGNAIKPDHQPERRAQLIAEMVGAGDELIRASTEEILTSFEDTDVFGKVVFSLIRAGVTLSDVGFEVLPPELAKQVISALTSDLGNANERDCGLIESFSSGEIGVLYRSASGLFERFTFPSSGWGNDLNWDVDKLRVSCLRTLALRGGEGLDILHGVSASESLATILGSEILRTLVDDWWQPFKQDELIRLLTESGTGVVRTPGELLRVVAHAITLYEASLRGIGGGVELLWAEDRPRQETVLSIDLARFLKQHFAGRNIVLNREVEVKPASENPILEGERSDILVQATEVGRPTVSLVVEIKGSWNPEKYTGYERQLVTRYLASPEAGCGLHVVFWFDRDSWDIDDSRRKNSPKDKLAVVRQLCSKRPLSTKPIDHVVIDAGRAIQQA